MRNKRTLSLLFAIVFTLATFAHPAMGKSNTVVRGNSVLEYAQGDIDMNGAVSIADSVLAMRHALGLFELTAEQIQLGDMDGDGDVDTTDAIAIQRLVMGLIGAEPDVPAEMTDITNDCTIRIDGTAEYIYDGDGQLPSSELAYIIDGIEDSWMKFNGGATVTINAGHEPIGGVYIKFDRIPPNWTLNGTQTCGQDGFLHEFQRIDGYNTTNITMQFYDDVSITDIFVFSLGEEPPADVQVWRPSTGACDIMLIAAHSDDDQLFFAGAIPDAVARGAEMQVCFFTHNWAGPFENRKRPHEQLNALWACGLTRYPVVAPLPDAGRWGSINYWNSTPINDWSEDVMDAGYRAGLVADWICDYRPQIVLSHDVHGEYGHSAHIAATEALIGSENAQGALDIAREREEGGWEVSKVYLHWCSSVDGQGQPLHDGGPDIDFDVNTPLPYFGDRTAYQVSQDAFLYHKSQLGKPYEYWLLGSRVAGYGETFVTGSTWFGRYGNGDEWRDDDKNSPTYNPELDGTAYSPRYYECYYLKAGLLEDVDKTHFYENITLLNGVTY